MSLFKASKLDADAEAFKEKRIEELSLFDVESMSFALDVLLAVLQDARGGVRSSVAFVADSMCSAVLTLLVWTGKESLTTVDSKERKPAPSE